MITLHQFTLKVLALSVLAVQAMAAPSKDFDAAMERLLADYSGSMVGDPHDQALLNAVYKAGSPSDFQAALWTCLKNPARRSQWPKAIQLSSTADIPDRDLATWARGNLELCATSLTGVGPNWLATMLSGRNGNPEDVKRLREIASRLPPEKAEQAKIINQTADSIRDGQLFLQDMRRQEAEAVTTSTAVSAPKSPASQQSTPQVKTHEKQPAASAPTKDSTSTLSWSLILGLIVAATGLLWLLVKKRK